MRTYGRRVALLALLASSATSVAARTGAQPTPVVHVVRPGETLASIAQRYYGDPRRESVLVAENGLQAQGGSPIVVGMRLLVPHVAFERVREGESWASLAERHYGDARRAFVLAEHNGASTSTPPDVGAEILVPYPLRHVASQTDTLRRVAEVYYGPGDEGARVLRRFNGLRGNRLVRGQIVLVPLADLRLSQEGLELAERMTGQRVAAGELRELQRAVDAELPVLREHVRRGRYAEAIVAAGRLLGAGELTGNQIVSVQRELAVAFVALDREDLAVDAFVQALRRQPDLELDAVRTSPRVLAALRRARERLARERSPSPTSGADAGPTSSTDAGETGHPGATSTSAP
ncbi:MAG: LysM peptidoglycan-binding domain-containing protein [Myxococcota bacterium]|nr:LysM peptidoglycan-binding domain-containing protein [Myxococcota bacterium]MDW8362973.1 LysM domain-containing protein [Myxococcales bacterium]